MTEPLVLVAIIVFIGAMIQGMMGFGSALFAMPLMVAVLGIQIASPSFALISLVGTLLNAVRWRGNIAGRDIMVLIVPALIGVPLGVLFLNQGDPDLVTRILGTVLIAYGLYSLLGRALPPMTNPSWGAFAGFFSGILTGAFNAGGPPVVVYASARNWLPDQFKGNLAAFFFVMGAAVIVSHAVSGHLTPEVWRIALLGLPALYAGQLTGVYMGKRVNPMRFNQLVLIFLVVLGIQLLV